MASGFVDFLSRGQRIAAAVSVGLLLWSGSALGQGKPTCTPQGKNGAEGRGAGRQGGCGTR
jgi:hypothetical protein